MPYRRCFGLLLHYSANGISAKHSPVFSFIHTAMNEGRTPALGSQWCRGSCKNIHLQLHLKSIINTSLRFFMTASLASTLDLRHIAPSARHAHIFSSFAALLPGQSLQLVNDHDPQPLNEQLQMRSPGQFSWTYLEQGPQVWRVEIGKSAKAAAPASSGGCCGGGCGG
jgi:uncharacterized protein (DUF2249 family)